MVEIDPKWYIYQIWDGCSSEMIGLYSSREKARKYIDLVTKEEGFDASDWYIEAIPVDDFGEFNKGE